MLDIIAANKVDVQSCCTELFQQWLKEDYNANWNKLLKALNKIGYNSLVQKIKTEILKGIVVSSCLNIYVLFLHCYVNTYMLNFILFVGNR